MEDEKEERERVKWKMRRKRERVKWKMRRKREGELNGR